MPAISNVEKLPQPSRRLFADCHYQAHRLCPGVRRKGLSPTQRCSCPCHGGRPDDARPARYGPYDSDVFDALRDGAPVHVLGPDALERAFRLMRERAQAGRRSPATTDPTAIGMGEAEARWNGANRERLRDAAEEIADKAAGPYDTLRRLLK